mgnify:CR=1 FL=1
MARKKNYIFTNKKHSPKAVMATVLGIISTISLVAVVYLAYSKGGQIPVNYGLTGLLITLFSIVGLLLTAASFMEKDRFKLFSVIGILLNGVSLVGIGLIVYAGMYL